MKKTFCLIFALIILIILLFENLYKIKYKDLVFEYSKEFNVDENLIFAIIKNESNFEKEAISNKNAKGLMQILETTKADIEKQLKLENLDLLKVEDNILVGTKYISNLIDKYDDINLAIIAYNAGQGNVDKWLEEKKIDKNNLAGIPFKETNMYLRKILRDYKIYKTKSASY